MHTINGIGGYDARSFLDGARENIINVLRNNRRTKVKFISKCNMHLTRTDEIKPYAFHSGIEFNLDVTDEKELYDTMVERILEEIAKFMSKDSDVRFHSVIKLELHTVEYVPMIGESWVPLTEELTNKRLLLTYKIKITNVFVVCS